MRTRLRLAHHRLFPESEETPGSFVMYYALAAHDKKLYPLAWLLSRYYAPRNFVEGTVLTAFRREVLAAVVADLISGQTVEEFLPVFLTPRNFQPLPAATLDALFETMPRLLEGEHGTRERPLDELYAALDSSTAKRARAGK